MGLRVVEVGHDSDVGRQREANEDSYVVAEPLFVVADGMGGAQAGEVASRTAAEVFEQMGAPDGTPEEQLTELVREANRRIHDLSQQDPSRRGMGTTCTVAMVTSHGITIAHVGDSRAYRLRDSEFEQLTLDHSLVAELERSGQLTPEAAEHHPQRSIITRALGPEADVEVDAHTHAGRTGDVYVLCSDGLTGMITDAEMAAILRGEENLEQAIKALIRAANQGGGRDNITAVAFRVEEVDSEVDESDTLSGQDTIHGGLTTGEVESAVRERERAPRTTQEASVPRTAARAAPASTKAPQRRGGRRFVVALLGLLVLALVAGGLYLGARQVYFIGTDDRGLVTLYRGLPYELPFGAELYSEQRVSGVPVQSVAKARRERLLDHEWRSRGDAQDLVRQIERGTLDRGAGSP